MKVFMKSSRKNYDAIGEYDPKTKTLIVYKGSKVADSFAESRTFKGDKRIGKLWDAGVENCIVTKDMTFNSASTAANFVTGQSSNGLRTWKTEEGLDLGKVLKA